MDTYQPEIIEQAFETGAPAVLDVSNIRGSTQITGGAAAGITVTARKIPGTGDLDRTRILIRQDADGRVRVETRYQDDAGGFLPGMRPCKVEYSIQVPAACNVCVSGVSNTTTVSGVSGSLQVQTVSGEVVLYGLGGKLRLNTVSADVSASNLALALEVETVSGNVTLSESRISAARVNTVSGNVRLQMDAATGPSDFKSVSGKIQLESPSFYGFSVISESVSGRLKSGMPLTRSSLHPGHHRYEIRGGGSLLHHNSISGDLVLIETGMPGEGEAAATGTIDVLERIDRGEISVDEALKLMEQMNAK